jgi:uncharacterized protein
MSLCTDRTKVRFLSGETDCVAWYYPGRNGACVITAAGLGVTKEPGTDPLAVVFQRPWLQCARVRLPSSR